MAWEPSLLLYACSVYTVYYVRIGPSQVKVRICIGPNPRGGDLSKCAGYSKLHVIRKDLVVDVPRKLKAWSCFTFTWKMIPPESEGLSVR